MATYDQIKRVSDENLKLLMRYYQRGTIVPFVGSGFSTGVCEGRFPDWKTFLLSYADQLSIQSEIKKIINDPFLRFRYEYAAAILANNDAAFSEKIQNYFSLEKADVISRKAIVQYLPDLFPQSPIVTTNLDAVLETVYQSKGKEIEQVLYGTEFTNQQMSRITSNRDHVLLKIHGCVKDKNTIVFSENQYCKLYGPLDANRNYKANANAIFPTQFKKLATEVRFLFLGCSLNEDRYLELLKQVKSSYKEDSNYHFAIVSAPSDDNEFINRQKYLTSCGILPIWYPSGQHQVIVTYLEKLLKGDNQKTTDDVTDKQATICLDGRKTAERFIDNIAQIAHNNNTDKNLARAIIAQNESINRVPSSTLVKLCNLISNITPDNKCPLVINGRPGTGKSTLLSLLYLNLPEPINCYTTLLDLHYFEDTKIDDIEGEFNRVLSEIEAGIEAHESSILFIDGFDNYERLHNYLAIILLDRINTWMNNNSIHFVFSIGVLDNDDFPPFTRNNKYPVFAANKCIELYPVDTSSDKFSFLTEKILKTLSIVPVVNGEFQRKNDAQNCLRDNIITFCKRITNGKAEYRTIIFAANAYKLYNNEMFNTSAEASIIGKIFMEYFSKYEDEKSLLDTAEHIAKFMLHEDNNPHAWTNSIVFEVPAYRDFYFALFYLNSIVTGKDEDLTIFNCIFTPSINRFIVALMVQDTHREHLIVNKLIERYLKFDDRGKAQAAYLFGRVKSTYEKQQAVRFLRKQYTSLRKSIDEVAKDNDMDKLMLFRSISISLIYLGDSTYEDDFFSLLICNEKLRDLNLNFHISYYLDSTYRVGDEVSLSGEVLCTNDNLDNLYNFLYHSIEFTDDRGRQGVNIITIISIIIYRKYSNKGGENYTKFISLMNQLENDTSITSPTLKRYIISIKDHLREQNIYSSALSRIYRMKSILRSGWLQEGREVDKRGRVESDADHTWGCCLLAQIFLTDKIEDCSFLSRDDRDKYANEYNKDKIINLLLVHDLPEIYTGDIPVSQQSIDKKAKEAVAMQKLAALDAFPQFRSFHNIQALWNEYESENNINSGIAYQIDKLEPLVQLYIYRDVLPEDKRKAQLEEWTRTAVQQINACKIQTSFGSNVLSFISTHLLNEESFGL